MESILACLFSEQTQLIQYILVEYIFDILLF